MTEKIANLVWLKRDLRTQDHAPLLEASLRGKAIVAYIWEEDYWKEPEASLRHQAEVATGLLALDKDLQKIGTQLVVLARPNAQVGLAEICQHIQPERILCHQETGTLWTFERDKLVSGWARSQGIEIQEWRQNGVRRARRASDWANDRAAWIEEPPAPEPSSWENPDNWPLTNERWQDWATKLARPHRDPIKNLSEFLEARCLLGAGYPKEMSSPILGAEACSRTSADLTWGMLSTRTAHHMASQKPPVSRHHQQQIESFLSRLVWRDHFIQKFEELYWMEWRCLNPDMETRREAGHTEELQRWETGQTGYPYIDACMRFLSATGWIPFRARAMVASFAAYALNLDWRTFGHRLAQDFVDFEPGIHFSQLQMQSGTTILSPPRIYSPLKQSQDQDPEGKFIREWVPELRDTPTNWIHLPHGFGKDKIHGYPEPIVDASRLWAVMRANGPQKDKEEKKGDTPQLELALCAA